MQRITITIDDDLMAELDRAMERTGYANRSEALRDLARAGLKAVALEKGEMDRCVGILSYAYDHEVRDMAQRLNSRHHDHHDLSVAALHVHIDKTRCLEVSVLRGKADQVRSFASEITAQRAVYHGSLAIIPETSTADDH